MKLQTILIFAGFICFIGNVSTQESPQIYCGRRLASALALVCDGNFIKRSEMHQNMVLDDDWPWLPQHRALSMGRSKRQVVSECCDKPCSKEELMTYCAY